MGKPRGQDGHDGQAVHDGRGKGASRARCARWASWNTKDITHTDVSWVGNDQVSVCSRTLIGVNEVSLLSY